MLCAVAVAALACAAPREARQQPAAAPEVGVDALARTPPMGWNSWNHFHCDVDETIVRQTADALVATGMRDAGYRYVVVDDCWQASRDDSGDIVPDPNRFPSGIRALADYVHDRGLAFGLYSDVLAIGGALLVLARRPHRLGAGSGSRPLLDPSGVTEAPIVARHPSRVRTREGTADR
jgi:hypothetical protein